MKVFISQPMRGKTLARIEKERNDAIYYIKTLYKDVDVIDSILDITDKTPVECLGESIKLLSQADIVYFCKDWENYRGCRIEHNVCVEYDIKTLENINNVVSIKEYVNTKNQN